MPRSPARASPTQKVTKMESRRTELDAMLTALENRGRRLQLERTDLLIEQAEADRTAKNEAAALQEERFREAQEALTRARNEAAWAYEHVRTLSEQRRHLENRLLESD